MTSEKHKAKNDNKHRPLLRHSGNAFKAGIQVLALGFKQGQKKHLDPWYKHSGMTSKKHKAKINNKHHLLLRHSGNAFKAGIQVLALGFQ